MEGRSRHPGGWPEVSLKKGFEVWALHDAPGRAGPAPQWPAGWGSEPAGVRGQDCGGQGGAASPPRSGFLDPRRLQLAVQTKRVAAQVDGGAQVQQVLNIECLRDFLTPPLLSVRFR